MKMIKETINKIDNELKSFFDSVLISESQEKSKFLINIEASKVFENKRIKVKVVIEKPHLESNIIRWKYLSNPQDSNSFLVERISSVDSLANDITDIVQGKKLDAEYLKSLREEIKQDTAPVQKEDDREELIKLMEYFGLKHLDSYSLLEDHVFTTLAYFKHKLKNKDKMRVQMALEAAGWTNYIWNADKLLVKFYN